MTSPMTMLDIGRSFSREPIGRYRSDGSTSGEVFREEHLVPALRSADVVVVNLDGTEGYGSSFLDEAFAGLLRAGHLAVDQFDKRITIVSKDDPTLIEEIRGYVHQEEARLRSHTKV